MATLTVAELWRRLREHQGEVFTQIRGGEFTYTVDDAAVRPDRTDRAIPRSHWEQALALVPLSKTVAVQHLFGPSYIYAVLMDRRVRRSDW
jgi:hypothetical protein